MKVSVKTLKGNHFDVDVSLSDTVMAVKKRIEDSQGKETFPCAQQLLIYKGKVLKDETTMQENSVTENSFLVVMLTKTKAGAAGPSTLGSSASASAPASAPIPPADGTQVSETTLPPAPVPAPAPSLASPATTAPALGPPAAALNEAPAEDTNVYERAASSLVAGTNLEQTVQQILEMGGGSWDRDTVMKALRAAYNNPERAVEYLYNGIPDATEVAVPAPWAPAVGSTGAMPDGTATAAAPVNVPSGGQPGTGAGAGPNAAPLDLFPQGMPGLGVAAPGGALDFLRNNPQFQALRSMVQANPQILLPMLQELGKQNPQLFRLINENQSEFLRLINEAGAEGSEGDALGQLAEAMPHSVNVTAEEREAIERLEALGFDRARVIEAFLACDRNELMAANYLLEDQGENEE